MESISICNEQRILPEKEFDLSDYSKTVFGMFGGEKTEVSIQFTNDLAGVVFDQFGTDIPIVKIDNNHFKCIVKVAVSNQFLSWIMSFGNRAKILYPTIVSDKLKKLIEDVKSVYN